jgi:uridine nucleosidase
MAAALLAEAPGRAWLVATGALTNVAALLARHPAAAGHIAGLSLMGGAVGGGFTPAAYGVVDGVPRIGNWTQFAEFNIVVDPEAAAAIFANPVVAPKTTMIPLDVTHLVLATREVQELLLYGPEGKGAAENAADEAAGEAAAGKKGKTVLRTMLVELLNFFASTYR